MFDSFVHLILSFFGTPVAYAATLQDSNWQAKTPVQVEAQVYPSKTDLLTVSDETVYWVTAVLDGDTLLVSAPDRSLFQVRLLAVNTKEINGPDSTAECYGIEASNFTLEFLKDRAVRLTADPANQDTDPFDRKLRYVDALQPDGSYARLNDVLLKAGMATYPAQYPTSTPDYFKSLEATAKANNLGLWGACQ